MKPSTRKDLAFVLSLVGVGTCVVAQFFSGGSSWWLIAAILGTGIALVLVAAFIAPPFWWGNRSFTTPLEDPSHEARHRDEF